MKTFVIGDIHGGYRALIQCLERCGFDYENDTLISLGDIVDGWSDVYNCVEELLKIKNFIGIRGNHDDWFLRFINTGIHPINWMQGGLGTFRSYLREIEKEGMYVHSTYNGYTTALNAGDIPELHKLFFRYQLYYYELNTEKENFCFVHGGFDLLDPIEYQHPDNLMWDRNLFDMIRDWDINDKISSQCEYDTVFIGHTRLVDAIPFNKAGLINLDTGAGGSGKLTIMDINTKEYWQSDYVASLYPDDRGRF